MFGVILLVEDNPLVRRVVERTLSTDHAVVAVGSAQRAREVWEQRGGAFDLLVTDVVMPGEHGLSLADDLSGRRPELQVLVITAFAPDEMTGGEVRYPMLCKPFTQAQLRARVKDALSRADPASGEP